MIALNIIAPFGSALKHEGRGYRGCYKALSPPSVYGMLMNLCGINCRDPQSKNPELNALKKGLPEIRIAFGFVEKPRVNAVLNQAHCFDTRTDTIASSLPEHCKRNKEKGLPSNIKPVTYEYFSGINLVVIVDGNEEVENLLKEVTDNQKGLGGIPYIGQSQYMISNIKRFNGGKVFWVKTIDDLDQYSFILQTFVDRSQKANIHENFTFFESEEIPEKSWIEMPRGLVIS